jgi:diamine N-acetyltransferase
MALERRDVTRDTLWPLIRLEVRPDQRDLVSSNMKTFAEAPFEPGSRVWGLWDGEVPVGLMAMVHPAEYLHFQPGDDREAAYLWRLMIAAPFQGRGYGRQAVAIAVQVARAWGCPRITAGVADVGHSNMGFYERLGFRWTGGYEEGEKVIVMDVPPGAAEMPQA